MMAGCFAYVKWYDSCSVVFSICSGVRQGAVLSPILFAIYVDDIGKLCNPKHECFVLLYLAYICHGYDVAKIDICI